MRQCSPGLGELSNEKHEEEISEAETQGPQSEQSEELVGTAEVSFDRITHSRHLYLNPPAVRAVCLAR